MKKRNVVVDLGGVVIDLRRERAVEELVRLGLSEADTLLGLYRQEPPFLDLETGLMTAGEFYDILRAKCVAAGYPAPSDTQIQEAFNAFLISLPKCRLEALRAARRAGLRLYVLSNTNPVMFNSWIAAAFRQEGLTINDYFDGVVVSFQEGCCKPEVRIFRRVLDRYGLEASETVMLDDSEANCAAAREAGMEALHITGQFTLTDALAALCDGLEAPEA